MMAGGASWAPKRDEYGERGAKTTSTESMVVGSRGHGRPKEASMEIDSTNNSRQEHQKRQVLSRAVGRVEKVACGGTVVVK